MEIVVMGQLATPGGAFEHRDLAGGVEPGWLPAVGYLTAQPAHIPLLFDHDEGFQAGGEVGYLERSKLDGLLCVGQVSDDLGGLLDGSDWYLSPHAVVRRIADRQFERAELVEVSLTRFPANCGVRPVRWSRSALPPGRLPTRWYDTWSRGVEAIRARPYLYRRSDLAHLTIHDRDPLDAVDQLTTSNPRDVLRAAERRRALADLHQRLTPTPTPRASLSATEPKVRLYGKVLSGEAAARIIEALEFD